MKQRTINISLSSNINSIHVGHILPVNRLLSTPEALFSGGRDGVVIQYSPDTPRHDTIYTQKQAELHSDWVNDITGFQDKLVTASSDLSVQWWDPIIESHGVIGYHHDYVKALSNFNNNYIVSGGLDKTLNFWDINRNESLFSYENLKNEDRGSIYSLASNKRVVAFSDNDNNIVLFDPNSRKVITQLTTHTEIVKSIILNDSNYLLSGSSDGTVKLTDLRVNKVLKNYTFDHSVWSLHSKYQDDFEEFLVGDSDGSVYHVHGDSDTRMLIGKEPKGILSITQKDDEIWTSSMGNANITNWSIPSKTIHNQCKGIIRKRMLNNRRNVVTLNESNEIVIWDILKCCEQQVFTAKDGKTFDEVAAQFQTKEVLPSWFSVSIKSGKLIIIINESNFTNTEIYGDELMESYDEIKGLDPDLRYNLGKIFFMSLFQNFLKYLQEEDLGYREKAIQNLKTKSFKPVQAPSPNFPPKEEVNTRRFNLFSKKSNNYKSSTSRKETPVAPKEAPPSTPQTNILETEPGSIKSLQDTLELIQKHYETTKSLSSLETSLVAPPTVTDVPQLPIANYKFILNIKQKVTRETGSEEIDIFNDYLDEYNYDNLKQQLPKWVGDFIITNQLKPSTIQPVKIGFLVVRDDSETELPDINADSKDQPLAGAQIPTTSGSISASKSETPEPQDGESTDKLNLNKLSISSISSSLQKPLINKNSRSSSSSSTVGLPTPPNSSGKGGRSLSNVGITNNSHPTRPSYQPPPLPSSSPSPSPSSTTTTTVTPSAPSASGTGLEMTPPSSAQQQTQQSTNTQNLSQLRLVRLSAYNMLRIKKIKRHIWDKFPQDFKDSHKDDIEHWLELTCNDQVVNDSVTLATLRTYIWKNSGDVILKYRLKK